MSKLDEVVEAIRTAADADFAFVLTRRGRLVTGDAPPDMPEAGRMRLVKASRPLVGTVKTAQLTMPREELVPFGGAAPVDVYVAVAKEQAILCVVMASWADKRPIIPAVVQGLDQIAPLLERAGEASQDGGKESTNPPPAKPARAGRGKRRGQAMTGLVGLTGGVATASRALERPPVIQEIPRGSVNASLPEIALGEATLGRESLAALDREARVLSSIPEIAISEARLGKDSLAAIELEGRLPATSAPDVRVELVSMSRVSAADIVEEETARDEESRWRPDPLSEPERRATRPWVESPVDTKRSADAMRAARKAAAPRVTLKIEEVDEDVLEAVLVDELENEPPFPPVESVPESAKAEARPAQNSYEVWHGAVDEVTSQKALPPRPEPKRDKAAKRGR